MGVALLTSLSLFAGIAIASSTTVNKSGTVTNPNTGTQSNQKQLDANGCPIPKEKGRKMNPDGTQKEFKKIDPARIEELKKKLNTGKVTKEEAAEIIELIDRRGKGRGPRPDRAQNVNNTGNTTNQATSTAK